MKTDNGSNEEVDYEQNGGGNPVEEVQPVQRAAESDKDCRGHLDVGASKVFTPCGRPPWFVTFRGLASGKTVTSGEIHDAGATVKLGSDWKVTVS